MFDAELLSQYATARAETEERMETSNFAYGGPVPPVNAQHGCRFGHGAVDHPLCGLPREAHDHLDHDYVDPLAFSPSEEALHETPPMRYAGSIAVHDTLVRIDDDFALNPSAVLALLQAENRIDGATVLRTVVYLPHREHAIVIEKPLDEVLAILAKAAEPARPMGWDRREIERGR